MSFGCGCFEWQGPGIRLEESMSRWVLNKMLNVINDSVIPFSQYNQPVIFYKIRFRFPTFLRCFHKLTRSCEYAPMLILYISISQIQIIRKLFFNVNIISLPFFICMYIHTHTQHIKPQTQCFCVFFLLQPGPTFSLFFFFFNCNEIHKTKFFFFFTKQNLCTLFLSIQFSGIMYIYTVVLLPPSICRKFSPKHNV